MRQEKETGGILKFLGLKRVLAANIAIFALVGWGFAGEYLRNREMQQEIDSLEGRAASLQEKNDKLAEATERFGSTAVIEREARLKLNLQKPGETVVVVRETAKLQDSEDPAGPAPEGESRGGTNPSKWWHYFFR